MLKNNTSEIKTGVAPGQCGSVINLTVTEELNELFENKTPHGGCIDKAFIQGNIAPMENRVEKIILMKRKGVKDYEMYCDKEFFAKARTWGIELELPIYFN